MNPHLYLLDTNVLSDLIKCPAGSVARKIASLDSDEMCCSSIIVACELRYGAFKKNSPALTVKVNQLLDAITVLPLDLGVEYKYAELRATLEKAGTVIGGNDLLIAAHALTLNLIVVTANEREFSRVPELIVENWLKSL